MKQQPYSFMRNTFTRRFTNDGLKGRQRESLAMNDTDETLDILLLFIL